MRVIIIYQIKDLKLKNMVRRMLLNLGRQLLPNVFECELGESEISRLKADLAQLRLNDAADCVVAFPLGLCCIKNIAGYGPGFTPFMDKPSYIIM